MCRVCVLVLLAALGAYAQAVRKSPVDLLREGRIIEAQKIIEQTEAPERYHLLLDALREPNAIEACFLYREISARFPGTDCDEFAQERLLQAAALGIDISALVLEATPAVEPGEWSDASVTAYEVERPLIASTRFAEQPVESEVTATPEETENHPSSDSTEVRSAATPETVIEQTRIDAKPDSLERGPAAAPPQVEMPKPAERTREGYTLSYGETKADPDTGVKQAALSAEQLLVKPQDDERPNVKPRNAEPARPHDIEASLEGEWYVQVGAFGNHDNAHKFAARLRADGYKVVLVPRDALLQVRVGGYASKTAGRAAGDQIKAKYDCPAVLVTQP